MDSNEIFASLKGVGGGTLQLVMGSAAEEKSNSNGHWSEDEADSLLSLVGGWRLDEYANGGGGHILTNGHCHTNGVTPNGITNGISNGVANVSSCVIHAMPHVCWCEVCSKGLCRVCSQVWLQFTLF